MKLYPYQQNIFDQVVLNFKTKDTQMVVIPTGGGKTVVFAHLAKYFDKKTLVVAHTKELVEQATKTMGKVGFTKADVMSIQRCGVRMSRDMLGEYDFLIIDECHRAGAQSYQKLMDKFKGKMILGVTATPFRHDGQKLADIFSCKVAPMNIMHMIEEGLLSDFEGYRIKTNVSLSGVKVRHGDFSLTSLASVVNVKNRNELMVKEYLKIAPGEKAICFAVNVTHAIELAQEFNKHGVSCCAVYGSLSLSAREAIMRKLRSGQISVITNCNLLTEGFDEPSVSCLLMGRPTRSKVLYTQMIGRGSRLHPGKTVCKVIEFTDNEYDVCSMEDLVSHGCRRFEVEQGERMIHYLRRIGRDLLMDASHTIQQRVHIIPRPVTSIPATPWQTKYLSSLGIEFDPQISEIEANQLISRRMNANQYE